jgi:trigger factor
MKTNLEQVSPLGRKLSIEIPLHTVQEFFKKSALKVQKQAEIKGFRPGKAPLSTVKQMYFGSIVEKTTDSLINTHFFKGLEELQVTPAGRPEFEFEIPEETKPFSFTASFEVYPTIETLHLEGLTGDQLQAPESWASQVDERIEKIRQNLAQWELCESPAEKGYRVTFDLKGELEPGQLNPKLESEGLTLELGSQQFIKGFEEALEGVTVGEERTLNLVFPEAYHAEEFSGKPVTFFTKIKTIEKKILPALDEAFLKSVNFDSLEQFRQKLEEELVHEFEKKAQGVLRESLTKSLISLNPVELPQAFVERKKEMLTQSMVEDFKKRGLTETMIEGYLEKWEAELVKLSQESAAAQFLLEEVTTRYHLSATDEDFSKKMEEYVAKTGIEMERVMSYYSEPERKERKFLELTQNKVMDFLSSKASFKQIPYTQEIQNQS